MTPMKHGTQGRGGRARSTRANGVWRLSLETKLGPILKGLDDIAFVQKEWKPAFRILAGKMAAASRRAFATGTGPDGYKWRPLTEDYSRRKATRAMLYQTGRLQGIATNPAKAVTTLTNNRMVYEINLPYATTHQFGSKPVPSTGFGGARVRNYLIWGARNDPNSPMKQLFHQTLSDYGSQRIKKILRKMEA